MALIYRAIWNDTADHLCDFAANCFEQWVHSKHPALDVPEVGVAATVDGATDVDIFRSRSGDIEVCRLALHEERMEQRWTTTLLAICAEGEEPVLWVDLEYVAVESFASANVIAPRLVRDLLQQGKDPRRGPVRLRTRPAVCPADRVQDLAAVLLDPARDAPVVVFSSMPSDSPAAVVSRAQRAADILAGVANVEVLTPDAVDPLIDLVGKPLGVWGGAVRVYLPGFALGAYPYPHFVVRPEVVARHERQAGLTIARRLAPSITARRPPSSYARARLLLAGRFRDRGADELETELENAWSELDSARKAIADEQDRYLEAAADLEELNTELTGKIRIIEELTALLVQAGVANERVALDAAGGDETLPDTASSCTEAVATAQLLLPNVVIPDGALRDLDDLDAAVEAQSWGATSWRAFRALDAYARAAAQFSGFWNWCERSGHPWAWPATTKKLSMTESDGVMNDKALRDCRLLPVDSGVDESRRILMTAHIKVAEGGGPLAPRIYFFDDTKGSTGKVHVGYFGPHRNMPNKGTN